MEIQHADEEGADGANTTEPDIVQKTIANENDNEKTDEEEAGDEVGGTSGRDSDPVTIKSGTIKNSNESVSFSNVTTATVTSGSLKDQNATVLWPNNATDLTGEKDENSPELHVMGATHDENNASMHQLNYTESEPPEEDSEFSGIEPETLASSGNGTGIIDGAVVKSGANDIYVEADIMPRSSNIDLETTMDGHANGTSVTGEAAVVYATERDRYNADMVATLDGLANETVAVASNKTKSGLNTTKTAYITTKTEMNTTNTALKRTKNGLKTTKAVGGEINGKGSTAKEGIEVLSGAQEVGDGTGAINGSLAEAKKPQKSPEKKFDRLEEDSMTREDVSANETFASVGSEMKDEGTGVLNTNFTLSNSTGLPSDSMEPTPAANDDIDSTNSTLHTTGVISVDSSNSTTLDSIEVAGVKANSLESGIVLRAPKIWDAVATARQAPIESEPDVMRLNGEDNVTETDQEAIPSVSLVADRTKTLPVEGDIKPTTKKSSSDVKKKKKSSKTDVKKKKKPSKSKRVFEVDTKLSVADDVDSSKSMLEEERTAEEAQHEKFSEVEESKENTDAASASRPSLRGASMHDVEGSEK